MERAIQVFAAVSFLVIGLSHIFQPGTWVEFFTKLRSLGRLGAFAEGFISLNFGAVIVSFHNVWSGPAVVLTLIGWGQVLKALFRFVAPAASLRLYERISPERAWQFRLGGGVALVLSAFLVFLAVRKTIP
ncbi:MAG: hypothetical protein ABUT39_30130 [Acidobacteriota bacterium]